MTVPAAGRVEAMARASLGLLALAGAVLVLLPSEAPLMARLAGLTPWAEGPALWLGNAAALLALAIALALVGRPAAVGGARDLAAFLTLGSVGWGVLTLAALDPLPELRAALAAGAWVLATGGFARFWLVFPRALTDDDLRRIRPEGPVEPATTRALARALAELGRALERLLPASAHWYRRLHATNRLARQDERQREIVYRTRRFLARRVAEPGWWIAGAMACIVLAVGAAPVGPHVWSVTIPLGLLLTGAGGGLALLQYDVAEHRDRRRMLWVVEGLLLGVALSAIAAQVIVLAGVLGSAALIGAMPLVYVAGTLVFVACLLMATFFDGAFDPALAIRRTAVYTLLVGLLVFLFAIVENLLSDELLGRLGLDESLGGIIGGGLVAVVFLPLQQRIDRWVRSRVPELERPADGEDASPGPQSA